MGNERVGDCFVAVLLAMTDRGRFFVTLFLRMTDGGASRDDM